MKTTYQVFYFSNSMSTRDPFSTWIYIHLRTENLKYEDGSPIDPRQAALLKHKHFNHPRTKNYYITTGCRLHGPVHIPIYQAANDPIDQFSPSWCLSIVGTITLPDTVITKAVIQNKWKTLVEKDAIKIATLVKTCIIFQIIAEQNWYTSPSYIR